MGNTTSQVKTVGNYNVVACSNVEPVVQTNKYVKKYNSEDCKNSLFYEKCNHRYVRNKNECKCHILAYEENQSATITSRPAFYQAFCKAYNTHGDIVLSPDDIWMIICLRFTKYVNTNSEKMRELFVSHEGKKKLTVTTWNELEESQWTEFFDLMIGSIRKNTKADVADLLQANFSTTTRVERLLSTAVVMDTFKSYFDYGRCIPCCGIRNLMFMGTLDDWKNLQEKVDQIRCYSVDGVWSHYIDELKPIINEFVESYQGRVNKDFWDKIMNIRHGSIGSGSTSYVSGWILKFYGIYKEVDCGDITEDLIDVTVEIDNKLTGVVKDVNIVGGFTGVNITEFDGYITHRPQMSYMVYSNGSTK